MSKDKINPNYYKNNPIQTFDAITSQFTDAEKIGAIKFNVCKYIMRMGKKVETLEGARDDAGKAHWYCERLLKELTDIKFDSSNLFCICKLRCDCIKSLYWIIFVV